MKLLWQLMEQISYQHHKQSHQVVQVAQQAQVLLHLLIAHLTRILLSERLKGMLSGDR
jgi:hypothetical protein